MKQNRLPTFGLRYASLAVILALLTFASAAAPPRGSVFPGVSIKNFGKVDDHYYRGSQPKPEELAQLKSLGIKTVIDLRKDSERGAAQWARDAGLQYFLIPMKASTPATEQQTTYFLSIVNDPANWPLYVHCKGGRHRAGAMTAIYRITHDGWTADQAYIEMEQYDFNNGFFGGPGAQKKFVYSFYDNFRVPVNGEQK